MRDFTQISDAESAASNKTRWASICRSARPCTRVAEPWPANRLAIDLFAFAIQTHRCGSAMLYARERVSERTRKAGADMRAAASAETEHYPARKPKQDGNTKPPCVGAGVDDARQYVDSLPPCLLVDDETCRSYRRTSRPDEIWSTKIMKMIPLGT